MVNGCTRQAANAGEHQQCIRVEDAISGIERLQHADHLTGGANGRTGDGMGLKTGEFIDALEKARVFLHIGHHGAHTFARHPARNPLT